MAGAVLAALLLSASGAKYALREAVVLSSPEGVPADRQVVVLVQPLKTPLDRGRAQEFVVVGGGASRVRLEALGSGPNRRTFTLVSGEHASCVANEVRRVAVSVERGGRWALVGEGALVGGCPVPEKRASLWALDGAHPEAVFVDGVSLRRDEIGRAEVAANGDDDLADRFEVESALRVGSDTVYVLSRFDRSDVVVVVASGAVSIRRALPPLLLEAPAARRP